MSRHVRDWEGCPAPRDADARQCGPLRATTNVGKDREGSPPPFPSLHLGFSKSAERRFKNGVLFFKS
eukprot:752218-Hanusia_phi.AAC.10